MQIGVTDLTDPEHGTLIMPANETCARVGLDYLVND
jgi:hypothetical protein